MLKCVFQLSPFNIFVFLIKLFVLINIAIYWNRTKDACLASTCFPLSQNLLVAQGPKMMTSRVRGSNPGRKLFNCGTESPKLLFFRHTRNFFRSKPEFFGIGRFYLYLERTHFVIFKGIMAAPRLTLLRHFAEMTSRYRNERCCLHKEEFSKKNLSLM